MCKRYVNDVGFLLIAILTLLAAIVINMTRYLSRQTARLHAFLTRRADDQSTEDP